MCAAQREGKGRVAQMMFSDKAFSIWMGHAGEDTQVFVQDEATKDVAAFEHTQVLAIARRDVMAVETMAQRRRQAQGCEAEGLAA
jgi:hypothetical protein